MRNFAKSTGVAESTCGHEQSLSIDCGEEEEKLAREKAEQRSRLAEIARRMSLKKAVFMEDDTWKN